MLRKRIDLFICQCPRPSSLTFSWFKEKCVCACVCLLTECVCECVCLLTECVCTGLFHTQKLTHTDSRTHTHTHNYSYTQTITHSHTKTHTKCGLSLKFVQLLLCKKNNNGKFIIAFE